MRNKLKLSPKTKTTVSVKRTLVYASVGVGMFLLIFTGAFFYLNMGNSEEAVAAPSTIIAKPGGGEWDDENSWEPNRIPSNGDIIEIPGGVIITINQKPDITLNNVEIKIFGDLKIAGSLFLNEASKIFIDTEGDIVSSGPGNSERLKIGNYTWKGDEFEAEIPSPGTLSSTGATNESLLPIVLDYFTAQVTATNSVLIEWGTVSEKENDFFTLERSSDGKTFEEITTVLGAGNSLKKLQYSFEDNKSTVGMNYYRLKQTDFNGDFEYFKIVGVNNKIGSSTATNSSSANSKTIKIGDAYPNPFKSVINLSFEAETDGEVEVLIQNARGEIVHKEFVSFYYGKNDYQFTQGDQLQSGVYYINLWSNGEKFQAQRLIKM